MYADAIDAAAISYGGAIPTGTNTGDQLIFANVAVAGQSTVVADSTADTLTLVAGSGISLATNAGADSITITGSAVSNSFGNVAVSGQSTVVADSPTDTLTFVAGSNITLTTDAGADSITINSTGGVSTITLTGAVTGSGTGTVATTLADDAVITSKLAYGAVITAKIEDEAISTAKIADANVTSAKIANLAVSTAKIADDAVTYGKFQHVSSQRILGRISSSTGQVEELTAANIRYVSETQAGRLAGGRLTLVSTDPYVLSDQVGKSTLYYTPYIHDQIALYETSIAKWLPYDLTERSIILSSLTSGKNYDVFIYNNSSTPTLELTAWTSNTARASALGRLNGVLVKNSDYSRRYVGTIRTTSSSTTEDSITKRFVWNNDNRLKKNMQRGDLTVHTYTSAVWRQWNSGSATRIEWVQGQSQDCWLQQTINAVYGNWYGGVGVDGSVVDGLHGTTRAGTTSNMRLGSSYSPTLAAGYHYSDVMQLLGTGTNNYEAAGMHGSIEC